MISIAIDKSLLFQVVNFVLLIFIMNALLYRPIREAIKKRAERFKQDEDEISRLKTEAEEKLRSFQEAIEEAKKIGLEKREALRQEGQGEEKQLLEQVYKEVEEQLAKVKAEIAKDIEAAREKLKGQAKAFSVEIAEKILGRPISNE
ncbi:MAG: ATP synthase F0 subunit B [Candidatus Desulfofervidaceae bacterium]|nr:ATP synthase F0 subunit B [Candidatus Desulfofervidaceae bacterium]